MKKVIKETLSEKLLEKDKVYNEIVGEAADSQAAEFREESKVLYMLKRFSIAAASLIVVAAAVFGIYHLATPPTTLSPSPGGQEAGVTSTGKVIQGEEKGRISMISQTRRVQYISDMPYFENANYTIIRSDAEMVNFDNTHRYQTQEQGESFSLLDKYLNSGIKSFFDDKALLVIEGCLPSGSTMIAPESAYIIKNTLYISFKTIKEGETADIGAWVFTIELDKSEIESVSDVKIDLQNNLTKQTSTTALPVYDNSFIVVAVNDNSIMVSQKGAGGLIVANFSEHINYLLNGKKSDSSMFEVGQEVLIEHSLIQESYPGTFVGVSEINVVGTASGSDMDAAKNEYMRYLDMFS